MLQQLEAADAESSSSRTADRLLSPGAVCAASSGAATGHKGVLCTLRWKFLVCCVSVNERDGCTSAVSSLAGGGWSNYSCRSVELAGDNSTFVRGLLVCGVYLIGVLPRLVSMGADARGLCSVPN